MDYFKMAVDITKAYRDSILREPGHIADELAPWPPEQAPDPEPSDEEPIRRPRRRLTRHEQLQELADQGCDTWGEYRGEK